MDSAVSLVQTYLRVNGYFTVTEFPVVEAVRGSGLKTATDLDVLACRFPAAKRVVIERNRAHGHGRTGVPDPELGVEAGVVDMIVGEVKESAAEFNPAGLRRSVFAAALARFGCCADEAHADGVAETLLRDGWAEAHPGHVVRLMAFGTRTGRSGPYRQIGIDHVHRFLDAYVRDNWGTLRHTESKDPALAFVMLREKARRAHRAGRNS